MRGDAVRKLDMMSIKKPKSLIGLFFLDNLHDDKDLAFVANAIKPKTVAMLKKRIATHLVIPKKLIKIIKHAIDDDEKRIFKKTQGEEQWKLELFV